jgi:hypothetical protein
MDKSTFYQIRVKGHLDEILAEWFDSLTISNQEDGEAVLSGCLPDQAALHGVLKQINNLGLTLISVNAVTERNCERKDHGYPGHNKS